MEDVQLCEIFNSSTEEEEDMEEDEGSSNEADSSCSSSLELESQDEMCMKSFQSYVVESGLVFQGPLQQGVQDDGEGRMGAAVVGGDEITTADDNHGAYHPVPLKSVKVEAALVHAVAQVQVTQIYRNEKEMTIDAVYFFPVDSNGAVTHFHVEVDGKIIKGAVKPKLNEDAKPGGSTSAQGKSEFCHHSGLFLVGEEEQNPDTFKISIGHLKAGQEIKVVLGYVTEVKNEPDSHTMRFFLPAAIKPKRVPRQTTKIGNNGRNSPELGSIQEMVDEPLAPLSIKVIASIQGVIKSVSCSTHDVVVESKGEIAQRPSWHKSIVTFDGLTTDMDRDFILLITPDEPIKPRLYAETLPNGSTTVMTYFVPKFKLDEQKTELIIIADRSESMSGRNIEIVKESMKLLLHSLPSDCYFNIVGFGSRHHFLFKRASRRCSDESLKIAMNYIKKIHANMGGTDLITPLRNIYEKPLIPGYFRQTIILTDGIVCNAQALIGLVKVNVHISRVFTFGIGSAPSHHLLQNIVQAGSGTCALIESESSICKATLAQLKNLLQPSLNDVKIAWNGVAEPQTPEKTLDGFTNGMKLNSADTEESKFSASPLKMPSIPSIFDGMQFLAFGLFEGNVKPTGAKITASSTSGPLTLELKLSEENDLGKTKMLHRLAAVKVVRELELEEYAAQYFSRPRREATLARIKDKIIKVASTNGISSKYTSFVAIDGPCLGMNYNCLFTRVRKVPLQNQYGYNHLREDGSGQVKCNGCRKICGARIEKTLHLHLGIQHVEHGKGKRPLVNGNTSGMVSKSRKKPFPSKKFRREETDIEPMDTTTMDDIVADIGTDEHHLLKNLTSLQCSQGSFPLNSSFVSLLSLNLDNLKEEAKIRKWDESAWATVLAIQFFKTKLLLFKDLWDFVAAKSQKWMISNHLNSTIAMMSRAKVLLKQNPPHLNTVE